MDCLWYYSVALLRRNKWKSICREAMLNDNAPDSGPLCHGFESNWGPAIFDFYTSTVFEKKLVRTTTRGNRA